MGKTGRRILAGIVVAGVILTTWYLYKNSIRTDGNPWRMLPGNPVAVIEVNNPGKLHGKLKSTLLWQSLTRTLLFKRAELRRMQLDSLLADQPGYLQKIKSNKLLIAFYNDTSGYVNTLFLSAVQVNPGNENIKHFLMNKLGPDYAVFYTKFDKYSIFRVIDALHNMKYFFALMDGVFVFSMDEQTVLQSINTYENNSSILEEDKDLQQLRRTSGKKADAAFYIHYPQLAEAFMIAADRKTVPVLQNFANFATWSETDIILKENEVLFTGYTATEPKNLLSRFKEAVPDNDLFNIVPFDADILLSLTGFQAEIKNKVKRTKSYLSDLRKFAHATGRGISIFTNAGSTKEYTSKLFISVNDPDGSLLKLAGRLAKATGNKTKISYQKHTIRRIHDKKLWETTAGGVFKGITNNYFTKLGNYLVFANSTDALKRMIDYYETGRTMDLNESFKKLNDNLQTVANVTLIISPRLLEGLLDKYLSPETAAAFKAEMETLYDFQYGAFQFTRENNLFYTNFYVRFSKSFHEENLALWKVTLDDEMAGKPFAVKNYKNGSYDIIVFDKSRKMYLINANGKILWKKKLVQLPIGDVEQVDYYKNGKFQYLFNTENNLYLIDRKGRFTGNYPIRIHPAATNSLKVFDYNRRKNYRILIAQADKRIYNYDIKGRQVKGWVKPKMNNIVAGKIQRLIANNKDYIIITDIDNNVKIVNRRGVVRIKPKGKLNKARNSIFYVNKTNSKGILLTTDTRGRLTYLSSSGIIRHTDFGKFSPQHYFLYEDFDGNGWRDFIYVDGTKLTVFDRFKKILFSYTFKSNIINRPEFFTIGNGKRVLGVTAAGEKTIYLFDEKGNTLISKGLTGEKPFTVSSLKNNSDVNLITGVGNVLYNYRIK